jgi:hypothetical protein
MKLENHFITAFGYLQSGIPLFYCYHAAHDADDFILFLRKTAREIAFVSI